MYITSWQVNDLKRVVSSDSSVTNNIRILRTGIYLPLAGEKAHARHFGIVKYVQFWRE